MFVRLPLHSVMCVCAMETSCRVPLWICLTSTAAILPCAQCNLGLHVNIWMDAIPPIAHECDPHRFGFADRRSRNMISKSLSFLLFPLVASLVCRSLIVLTFCICKRLFFFVLSLVNSFCSLVSLTVVECDSKGDTATSKKKKKCASSCWIPTRQSIPRPAFVQVMHSPPWFVESKAPNSKV